MQIVAYSQAVGLDDELVQQAAENHKGDSGRNPAELLQALKAKESTSIPWKCVAMNALFSSVTLHWLRIKSATTGIERRRAHPNE
jgi:hypothetical protein